MAPRKDRIHRSRVSGASTNHLQGKPVHTYSPMLGQLPGSVKLLFVPAARVRNAFSQLINYGRRFAVMGGIRAFWGVEFDPFSDARLCFCFSRLQVDAFVLYAPPERFIAVSPLGVSSTDARDSTKAHIACRYARNRPLAFNATSTTSALSSTEWFCRSDTSDLLVVEDQQTTNRSLR